MADTIQVACDQCGTAVPAMAAHEHAGRTLCGACFSAAGAAGRANAGAPPAAGDESWREFTCILAGALCLAAGAYFLLNPAAPGFDADALAGVPGLAGGVANLHRLALGQTLSVVGAIFLAVGIRPR